MASHAGLFSEGKKGDGWVNVAGGEASAEVMLTRSFDLPPGVNLEALRSEPGKTLKVVAGAMQKTAAESVTMGFDATGGVLGNGAGVAGELVVTGKIDDLARSGTIGKALAGDMKGAVAALPGSTTVDASLKRYSNIGVKVGPMISVMGFGAGIEFAARRRDADPSRAREFSKPAKEAAADLSAWLAASAKRA